LQPSSVKSNFHCLEQEPALNWSTFLSMMVRAS
jgi:hypothetical protein